MNIVLVQHILNTWFEMTFSYLKDGARPANLSLSIYEVTFDNLDLHLPFLSFALQTITFSKHRNTEVLPFSETTMINPFFTNYQVSRF